jgi:hypothetical protein
MDGISLIKIPYNRPLLPEQECQGMTITEPAEIKDHILQCNSQHFSQAQLATFAQEPSIKSSTDSRVATGRTIE